MRPGSVFLVTMALLGAIPAGARADTTLRCPSGQLVSLGDGLADVRAACGAPTWAAHRTAVRLVASGAARARWRGVREVVLESMAIDEWRYDWGPDRLIRLLTFENDVLVRIWTRGYGFRAGTGTRAWITAGRSPG